MEFNPKEYWNNRLNEEFSLKGVGYFTFSERYNRWLYARKTMVLSQKVFKPFLTKLNNTEVLDIGCGTGFFIKKFLEQGAQVTGVDISSNSIDQLTKKIPEATFHLLDLADQDGKLPKQFDVINMWDVMYHIVSESAFKQACANIASMSKKGTFFITTDLFGSDNEVRPAEHVTFRCLKQYEEILGKEGFKLVKIIPLYRYLNRHYRWNDKYTDLGAPFLFLLDSINNQVVKNNLSVSIWKFER